MDHGVHVPLIFNPSATPEFIPPQFFREHELPRLKTLCSDLKRRGAEAVWLHIAEDVRRILPTYKEIGIDIGNFDYPVSAAAAIESAPSVCLDGNVRSFACVNGDSDEALFVGLLNKSESRDCLIKESLF